MADAQMVAPKLAVFDTKTGAIVMIAPQGFKPASGQSATALPASYSDDTYRWDAATRAMVEDPARVEAMLLANVKAEAERRKMGFLSAGGAKKAEYAQKAAEVSFYDSLGGTVVTILAAIGAMTAAQRRAKFGYALADAAAFGDPTITNAIERFRSGMASSDKVPAIAAAEAKGCTAIKAAATASAKRAAAAAITWPA